MKLIYLKILILFLSYLNSTEFQNYEIFMKMKLINALKNRHIRDHIELTKLQLKLLNTFNI